MCVSTSELFGIQAGRWTAIYWSRLGQERVEGWVVWAVQWWRATLYITVVSWLSAVGELAKIYSTSRSTPNNSRRRWVFQGNRPHWYWQVTTMLTTACTRKSYTNNTRNILSLLWFVVDFLLLAVAMDKKSTASQSQRPHSVAVDFGASEDETLANNSRKGVVFLICKYNPLVILASNLLKFLMAVPEKVTRIVPFVQPL